MDKEACVLRHQNEEMEGKKAKQVIKFLLNELPKPKPAFALSLYLVAPEQYNATFLSSNGPSPGLFFPSSTAEKVSFNVQRI